jgi:prepilin-type N-terminal cleavage/methylation domain-containing protein
MRALRARLRDDSGFTLTELLLALAISMIVAAAALTILNVTLKRVGEVDQRVDSTQRGRMLMDTMTRELRSQICMTTDVPPIRETLEQTVGGSYRQSVAFYSDLTDGRTNAVPELRTLTYDDSSRTITEAVSQGRGTPPAVTYDAPVTRVIGTNVQREVAANGAATPIFSYYGFTTATATTPATPTLALPNAMANGGANVKMVARVAVRFRMLPTGRKNATRTSTVFADDVYVRAADPNDPAPIPTCA